VGGALESDVREVGGGQDVHHAPRLIHRVADPLATDCHPFRAAGAVAADDVLRPDGGGLPGRLKVADVLEGDQPVHPVRAGWR